MSNSAYKLYDVLPDFANDENRQLHSQIQQKMAQLEALENDCKDLGDRHQILKEHLRNVQLEMTSVERLVTEKEKQLEEELHLQQLAERERGKLQVDYTKAQQETNDIQSKWSIVQGKMTTVQNKIAQFQEEMQFNEKELQDWQIASQQKEEDFQILQKYQRDDENQIRQMIKQKEQLAIELESRKNELDQEITNTRSLQIELDETADFFKKIHEERAQLLSQWEQTLKQVQSLNQQIEEATTRLDSRKGEAEKYQLSIIEEKKNLDLSTNNNRYIERQITMNDHQIASKNDRINKEDAQINEFREVVATQRQKIDKLDSDERAYTEHIVDYHIKTQQQEDRKIELQERLAETEAAFGLQSDYTKDINHQTNLMNELFKSQENKIKEIEDQIDDTKKTIYKLTQEVFDLRKNEKLIIAEIQGSQSRRKNLDQRIKDVEKEMQRQLELLYNSNFSVAQMQQKISLIKGDTTEIDAEVYQNQINELEASLESKKELNKNLELQLNRLELDLRTAARDKDNATKKNTELSTKLNELEIDEKNLASAVQKTHKSKEQSIVQLNMLRIQVEKLTEQVEQKCNEMITLENRRQQLQLSLQERLVEIDQEMSLLKVQLKTEQEAHHIAVIELAERKKRESALQLKYDNIISTTEGLSDPNGAGVADLQSYRVIQFAKQRQEVTQQGDKLENDIREAIKQLRMLEKQMQKLNWQTDEFKKGFQTEEDQQQIEKKRSLEEQLKTANQRLNQKKAEAKAIEEEKMTMDKTYLKKQVIIEQMQQEITNIHPLIEKYRNDNKDLKDKLVRAQLALKKAKESHRKEENISIDSPYPTSLLEMNIELNSIKTTITALVTEITKLSEENREIEPKLSLGLQQIGLHLIHMPKPPSFTNLNQSPNSARSGHSIRSGSFKNLPPPIISPNSARSRGSKASNASRASRVSKSSELSSGSRVSIHQLDLTGL